MLTFLGLKVRLFALSGHGNASSSGAVRAHRRGGTAHSTEEGHRERVRVESAEERRTASMSGPVNNGGRTLAEHAFA